MGYNNLIVTQTTHRVKKGFGKNSEFLPDFLEKLRRKPCQAPCVLVYSIRKANELYITNAKHEQDTGGHAQWQKIWKWGICSIFMAKC